MDPNGATAWVAVRNETGALPARRVSVRGVTRRPSTALCVLALAAAVAGCGGDDDEDSAQPPAQTQTQTVTRTEKEPDATGELPAGRSDEQQIQAVWRQYTKALGEEDGETVCSLLTENGKKEVLSGQRDGSSCEEVVAEIGSFFKGFETELESIKVQGDAAEAVSPERGQVRRQALDFVKTGVEWKIDGASDIE